MDKFSDKRPAVGLKPNYSGIIFHLVHAFNGELEQMNHIKEVSNCSTEMKKRQKEWRPPRRDGRFCYDSVSSSTRT